MTLRLSEDEYYLLKQLIFNRDTFRCRYCNYRNNLHVHHIVFRSEQGPDETWNLVTLCNDCHEAVHQHKLSIWSEDQTVGADGELEFTAHDGWRPGQ